MISQAQQWRLGEQEWLDLGESSEIVVDST